MLITLISVVAALVFSLIATPFARRIAIRYHIFASTNHRTVHENLVPQLGGLSIFVAFAIGVSISILCDQEADTLFGLLIGGGLVLVVGLADDIYHLSCYRKLIGQTVAASVAVFFGFSINTIYLPWGTSLELGYWAAPLSVLWIVSITNAVNLMDGLDGLAAGFSILIALFVFIAAAIFQDVEIATAALVLVGATMGFLKYNFAPAKIFMGDMGSLFLGFVVACLSLRAFSMPATGCHIAVLVILFLIPLADIALSVLRRVSKGLHPFSADKEHIHHRLMAVGLSQMSAVLIIYAATFICGLAGLVLFTAEVHTSVIVLSTISLLALIALLQLNCFDFWTRKEYYKKIGKIGLN